MTNHHIIITQEDRDRAKLRSQRKWQTDVFSNLSTSIWLYKRNNKPLYKKRQFGMDAIPFDDIAALIVCIVRDLKRLDMSEEEIDALIKTAASEID